MSIKKNKKVIELLIDLKNKTSDISSEQLAVLKELFFSQFTKKRGNKNRPAVLKKHDDKFYYFNANSPTHEKIIVANGKGYILVCDHLTHDFTISAGSQDGYYNFENEKLDGLDNKARVIKKFLTESETIYDDVNIRFNFKVAYHKTVEKILIHNDLHKTAYDLDILLEMGFDIRCGSYPLRFVKFGYQVLLTLIIDGILVLISPFNFTAPYDNLFEITL